MELDVECEKEERHLGFSAGEGVCYATSVLLVIFMHIYIAPDSMARSYPTAFLVPVVSPTFLLAGLI